MLSVEGKIQREIGRDQNHHGYLAFVIFCHVGIDFIGGCCRTQPKDIEKIREIVNRHG